ncbi:MAG: GntR family transcriptional regulator [Vallitaleaceae bacterium]|nr:GntR family transcriptional regulator [Vallitaleaceae bacterium]
MGDQIETKYQLVKDYITEYIQKGALKFNDKIYSELELMNLFNVSRHTVRKAIDDLVNEGWLYKKQGKGTFISNPKANEEKQGRLIGVVATYLNDYIFPEIITGIDHILSQNGYSILLGNTNNKIEKERLVLKNMLEQQLDGLILEPTKSVFPSHNKDILQKFIDRGIPILYIHASYSNLPSSYIMEDDVKAGYIATEHLVGLGHKKIGSIFKNDDLQGHGRYEGMIDCLRQYDLPIDEECMVWFSTEDQKLFSDEAYTKMILKRLADCTALICYNDQIALQMMEILKRNQIFVPEDLSIVSFDNSNLAGNVEVKLTTIAHPKAALGERAASALLQMIQDKTIRIQEKMEPVLVERASTRQMEG